MASLGDFAAVSNSLKTAKRSVIVAMHKFIYQAEGDRDNRKRLRMFNGFDYDENSKCFTEKAAYVDKNVSAADLVSMCNILGIGYDVDDLFLHIFNNLRRGKLLSMGKEESENECDDDADETESKSDDNDGDRTLIQRRSKVWYSHEGGMKSELLRNLEFKQSDSRYNALEENGDDKAENNSPYDNVPKFSLNFRDVEDTIRTYDGTGYLPVKIWIEEFEETSYMLGWDDFQKYIYAKRSLKGLAKLFVAGERGINTWNKLKEKLIEEFQTTTNSAQLHKMLADRKMLKEETYHEYFLKMKQLASQGQIEDEAFIQYVIDGINDLTINKSILYGAVNINDFKAKLRCYTIMQEKSKPKNNVKYQTQQTKQPVKNEKRDLCFNCGEKGHTSKFCKDKEKGTKCFGCNEYGHISKECPQKSGKSNVRQLVSDDPMKKTIKFSNKSWLGLFDTGSKFNVVSLKVYNALGQPELKNSNFYLIGFGGKSPENRIKPMGNFKYEVEIDGEMYDLKFHVVPNNSIDVDVILGNEFCNHVSVEIVANTLKFKKIEDENEVHRIMSMNVCDANPSNILDIDERVSPEVKQKVSKMIENYRPEKSESTNVEMNIILSDDTPVFSRPRRLPWNERKAVEEQIDTWLEEGIIEESESEYSSPVVMVRKRDGSLRLCVDYRRINKVIVKDRYPLPLIEDQLDRLQDARIFSTIDLKNGFFHVDVAEASRKFTSFVTHSGQYQFRKVPFGLSNSPAVFQRFINTIFRNLTRKGIALPYVDDVIIPAKNEEEALRNLEEVFNVCKVYGLQLNLKKCNFLKRRIEFLGHIIENQQIFPSKSKVEAVIKFPIPINEKQLHSFLGLASYFRKFIPNFAHIAKPLSDLLKSNARFEFNEAQISSFNNLKEVLAKKPVLNIYNQQYDTEVHTDASMDGYGAILFQRSPDDDNLHPVYYMSKKTTDAERKYSSYELEILAVVEALKKFRVYLLGIHFKIVSDCNAFTKTMEKKDLCIRVARWVLLLQEYDYEVEHRAGSRMRHVDSLSRYPILIIGEDSPMIRFIQAQKQDEELTAILSIVEEKGEHDGYFIKNGVLYKNVDDYEVIVVPRGMQREIIRKAHENGNFSATKVKEMIRREYYIPRLDEKIGYHISNCVTCIVSNKKRGKQEGELHPLPKKPEPLHTYHIDHLGPLESTNKQYKHIFAVIDAFTKFCWLYPTKTTSTREVISKLRSQSCIFGNPVQIISDRGTAFTSEEFREYCESEDIQHSLITTGLPRANGQVERLNSTIVAVLSKLSLSEPSKWFRHVSSVQQVINSTVSRSTKTTPFELLVGIKMHTPEHLQIRSLIEDEMESRFFDDREVMRQNAKLEIANIQEENRKSFNKRRKKATKYKHGDLVAIKRTQFGPGLKLKPKFLGPYEVVKVKSNDTYEVSKCGISDGPRITTTCAEYMKPWCNTFEEDEEFETN